MAIVTGVGGTIGAVGSCMLGTVVVGPHAAAGVATNAPSTAGITTTVT